MSCSSTFAPRLIAILALIAFHAQSIHGQGLSGEGEGISNYGQTTYEQPSTLGGWFTRARWYENFDPLQADPRFKIKCFGEPPPMIMLGERPHPPAGLTLQQLCAKPQYGGVEYTNIGGFCQRSIGEVNGRPLAPYVAFDRTPTRTRISEQLKNPRLAYYCINKCFCSFDPENPTVERTEPPKRDRFQWEGEESPRKGIFIEYEIRIDNEAFNSPGINVRYERPHPYYTIAYKYTERERQYTNPSGEPLSLSIPERNLLTCSGPLPEWDLPAPFRQSDFRDLTRLCAAHLSNGRPGGNVGGVCMQREGDAKPLPYFLKEFTPHPSFENSINNRALAVRIFCFSSCRCANDPTGSAWPSVPQQSTIPWLSGVTYKAQYNGEVSFKLGDTTVNLVPENEARQGGSTGTSRCNRNDAMAGKCSAWPTEVLGPEQEPLFLEVQAPSNPVDFWRRLKTDPMCGATCTSRSDCTGSTYVDGCICAASSRSASSDRLWTGFFCVVAVAASKRPGRLNGRDISDYSDLVCPCNGTYVSKGCCGSVDGNVWEDKALFLGKVAEDSI